MRGLAVTFLAVLMLGLVGRWAWAGPQTDGTVQHVGLWTVGFELGAGRFRVLPQLHGFTARNASGSLEHNLIPDVELAWIL